MSSPREVALLCSQWDPNPETKAQTLSILEANDEAELGRLFGARLEFGTAGLRGPMGPGPNAMNDLTVIQAAQVSWLGSCGFACLPVCMVLYRSPDALFLCSDMASPSYCCR